MRVLIVSMLIVLADQGTKVMVKGLSVPFLGISWAGVPYASSRPVLGDFLRFTYIENPGMAFGIDLGGKLFFSLFSIVASVAIVVYLYSARKEPLGFRVSLAMILGGALGNLIDRVFYGAVYGDAPLFYGRVVDFIDMDFLDMNILGYQITRWPVFNIADAAVTLGVVLLLLFHRSVSGAHNATALSPLAADTGASDPPNGPPESDRT